MTGLGWNDTGFFDRVTPLTGQFRGQEISLPLLYRNLSFAFVSFAVPSNAVAAVLPDPILTPAAIGDGLSIATAMFFDYRDCDIAPYGEAGLVFPVGLAEANKPYQGAANDTPMMYVHRLPVTTTESLDLGRLVWEFPKHIGSIELQMSSGLQCRMSETDRYDLNLHMDLAAQQPRIVRQRLRPVLVGETINIAHVAIEALIDRSPDLTTLKVAMRNHFDDPAFALLEGRSPVAAITSCQARAILSPTLESLSRSG